MPTIETGLFLVMISMGLGLMLITLFKDLGTMSFLFRVFSCVLFFGLAMFNVHGEWNVSTITTTQSQALDSNNAIVVLVHTEEDVFIDNTNGPLVGWVFFGLAMFNVVLVFKNMFGDKER